MEERDVEKQVCRALWDAFDEFFSRDHDREDIRLLDQLRDELVDALPYSSEEA